jgi:hypothetical protein
MVPEQFLYVNRRAFLFWNSLGPSFTGMDFLRFTRPLFSTECGRVSDDDFSLKSLDLFAKKDDLCKWFPFMGNLLIDQNGFLSCLMNEKSNPPRNKIISNSHPSRERLSMHLCNLGGVMATYSKN